MTMDLLFLFPVLMPHLMPSTADSWWGLFWCWKGPGTGRGLRNSEWQQARNTKIVVSVVSAWILYQDLLKGMSLWFLFSFISFPAPTKEGLCISYQIRIRNEGWWFAWVAPLGRTKFHILFSPVAHIHLPHTVLWPSGWKKDAYQGLACHGEEGFSFLWPCFFSMCRGTE